MEPTVLIFVIDHHISYLGILQWGIWLRRCTYQEPPLLRIAAIGSSTVQPKSHLEGSFWSYRRPGPRSESIFFLPCVFEITLNPNWARYFGWWCKAYKVNRLTCDLYNVGWSCWRVLRRGWPCQIWPPNGLHHNNAIMECDRIRRADRGGRGVWPCLGSNQMGDWLFRQSPYTPKCALGWGTQHPTIFNSNTLEQGSIRFVHIIHSWSSQVGDGDTDHYCWQRPEDMTTSRQAYKIDAENPGSDLAGETAAAMAAASIVFRSSNPHYSHLLLHHAQQVSVWKFPFFFFSLTLWLLQWAPFTYAWDIYLLSNTDWIIFDIITLHTGNWLISLRWDDCCFLGVVVWVWGQAPRGVWWEYWSGEELLCVGEWVQGRVALGSLVAIQGHRQGRLFQVRYQQRALLWWDWLGYNWVQLGCQICWCPDPGS